MRLLAALALFAFVGALPPSAAADGYDDVRAAAAAELAGKHERALGLFTRAIESGDLGGEDLAHAHFRRGALRAFFGQTHAAIEDLTVAIDRRPNFGAAHSMRGYLRAALGEDEAAERDHNRALDLAPAPGGELYLAWALQHYADLRRRQRRFAEALDLVGRSLAARDFADAYFRRAWIHLDMGKLDEARADYRRFTEIMQRDRRLPSHDFWPDERDALGRLKVLSELK